METQEKLHSNCGNSLFRVTDSVLVVLFLHFECRCLNFKCILIIRVTQNLLANSRNLNLFRAALALPFRLLSCIVILGICTVFNRLNGSHYLTFQIIFDTAQDFLIEDISANKKVVSTFVAALNVVKNEKCEIEMNVILKT